MYQTFPGRCGRARPILPSTNALCWENGAAGLARLPRRLSRYRLAWPRGSRSVQRSGSPRGSPALCAFGFALPGCVGGTEYRLTSFFRSCPDYTPFQLTYLTFSKHFLKCGSNCSTGTSTCYLATSAQEGSTVLAL